MESRRDEPEGTPLGHPHHPHQAEAGAANRPPNPAPAAGPRAGSNAFDRTEALRRLAAGHRGTAETAAAGPVEARRGGHDEQPFDVLVIGGGVTGAGVALDAASRGLRTALIEKGDFASGTSSKSSKMVHGGLRYLQQREFRLVYENLAERQRLLDNAPHLVSPLPFLIPLFGREGAVSKTVARSYSLALWLYDLTGGLRIGKRHRRVGRAEALGHLPTLNTDFLVAGFLYYDARADDARLTLALLRTAVLDHGAVAANYLVAESFIRDHSGRVTGVRARPTAPVAAVSRGHLGAGDGGRDAGAIPTVFDIRAKVVVNATGVWADDVRAFEGGGHPHTLRPAKGVHVTVPASRLPADIAAVIPVRADRRSIFVVPWPEADLVYLGTTDTGYDGPLDDPACTPEDVDYLLAAANAVTSANLTRHDVTGLWAGLRPLLAPAKGSRRKLSARTADLSRRHTVRSSPEGVVTVTGGKLTTYRKMAQDTVDRVVDQLAMPGRTCVTANLALRGAPSGNRPARWSLAGARSAWESGSGGDRGTGSGSGGDRGTGSGSGGDRGTGSGSGSGSGGGSGGGSRVGANGETDAMRSHLFGRYGTETDRVLALGKGRPELLQPVVEGLPYLGVELLYAVRAEMAQNLDDVLARRSRAQIQQARASVAAAPAVARLLAPELGWTEEQAAAEATRFTLRVLGELEAAGLPSEPPAPSGPGGASARTREGAEGAEGAEASAGAGTSGASGALGSIPGKTPDDPNPTTSRIGARS